MESLPLSPTSSGATTEPITPDPVEPDVVTFAMLIPMKRIARSSIDAAACSGSEYHKQFIKKAIVDNKPTKYFELSVATPERGDLRWMIGSGRQERGLSNDGVDLLLYCSSKDSQVDGIDAHFSWLQGMGGFFLNADNSPVMMDGEIFRNDQRVIPPRNTIMLGECVFVLRYATMSIEEVEKSQNEMIERLNEFTQPCTPLVFPWGWKEKENDMRFGDWIIEDPMSRRAFGTVYMVTNDWTGQAAAARQIFKSGRNAGAAEPEFEMSRRISKLTHVSSPFTTCHFCSSDHEVQPRLSPTLLWHHRTGQTVAQRVSHLSAKLYFISFMHLVGRDEISPTSRLSAHLRQYSGGIHYHIAAVERNILLTLLEAVAFLHLHGIWHRDIKPDNILVRSFDPPDVMLTGFECASDATNIPYDDKTGTEHYLAPEQAEVKTHNRAVDYWGCGMIGLELIGNRPIGCRIMPGPSLAYHHKLLDDSRENPPLARCSRKMLEAAPGLRLTAAGALISLSPFRKSGSQIIVED
ncbi:hypothetical protein N7445_005617 [Penicillium cf. griseofulvum]|nr:hypothetical protein N7445_005617 [Penicillium cf. griseofulvum]